MDDEVKKETKIDLKRKATLFLKIALVMSLIVIILFPAAWYVVKEDDGSFKENDWSNAPFAASQYVQNVSIGSDGKLTTNMTAQELWDKLMSEGSRVNIYLDGPEELQKLMNAELITQYLDTRENPDEPIDWEAIADVNSNEVQGIIKLKRAQADGTTSTMTYVGPETFQTYIDNYNASGSDADRQEALSHFTIEQGIVRDNNNQSNSEEVGKVNSLDGMLFIGDSITHGLDQAHTSTYWLSDENIELLKNSLFSAEPSTYAYHWLQRIDSLPDTSEVNSVCVLLGVNDPTSQEQMKEFIDKLVVKYSGKNIYIQKVFPLGKNGSGFLYTPDEMNAMIQTYNTDIQQYCETKQNVYFIDTTEGYVTSDGYLVEDKTADGVHFTDYNTWVENIAKAVIGSNSNSSSGDSDDSNNNSEQNTGEDILYWPTTSTTITSNFGYRDAPTAGASTNHGAIDIGVPSGSEVYATEEGVVTMAGWDNSGGNMIIIDHGNGYTSRYLHNSQLIVSAGDTVQKGQVIAMSGNTGNSTGPHLHFAIQYNGEPIDPLSFKYNNGMGNGTGGIGIASGTISSSDIKTVYYAKVATWNSVTDTVESNDPDVETYSTTTYNMTSTKINFQDFVSGYTMPFYYLWVLLVMSEDQGFILDLADLVYDSEIEITVHDNLTVNTNVNVYTYTEKTKTETMATVSVTYGSPSEIVNTYSSSGGPWNDEASTNYTTTHTVVTRTNTLDIQLTKANVWIVNYTRKYTYSSPEAVVTNTENDLEEMPYPASPNETRTGSDTYGHASALLASEKARWTESYEYVDGAITSVTERIYHATVNRHESITNTVEQNKYIASPPEIEEKTDKDSEEPNFVTILSSWENRKAKNYLLDASWMVFDLLESHESTADNMVDLTKYLFYKVSNNTKFWDPDKEFDWSIFDPANFTTNNASSSGTSGIEGVPGQIYDFLLQKGVPAVGAAAIVGNIQAESSFDPTAVNYLGCSGLCQWLDGRLDGLKALAASKGTDWTDVQTQLEHMWQELNTDYTGVKDVIMNATTEDDLEYATWYWGRHYEVYFTGSWPASRGQSAVRYGYAQEWYQKWKENHTSGGGAQLGEAASIQGTEERIAWLYDGNGLPTSEAENNQYLETFPVEYLNASGNRVTMNVTMHRKLKTEIQAIFREMADAGFKIVGGDISYRQWGSDAGFQGRFPQSAHTYGHAFDVNPDQNYCIYGNGTVVGSHYSPGSDPYSVTPQIINIWKAHGFYWGGDWTSLKDYMHFSYFNH